MAIPYPAGSDIDLALAKIREIVATDPARYFFPGESENPDNPEAQSASGEEIWEQTGGRLDAVVAILAFQSGADATVSTAAVVKALYGRLPNEGHRLVLFDANRIGNERQILKPEVFTGRDRLLNGPVLSFDLEVVTNEKDDESLVSSWVPAAGGTEVKHVPTSLLWPRDLFALSHVAVPVPADDPVYGAVRPARQSGRVWLGHAALYGERDMLLVPETALLRLRYNPFFPWMTQRIREALEAPVGARP